MCRGELAPCVTCYISEGKQAGLLREAYGRQVKGKKAYVGGKLLTAYPVL